MVTPAEKGYGRVKTRSIRTAAPTPRRLSSPMSPWSSGCAATVPVGRDSTTKEIVYSVNLAAYARGRWTIDD